MLAAHDARIPLPLAAMLRSDRRSKDHSGTLPAGKKGSMLAGSAGFKVEASASACDKLESKVLRTSTAAICRVQVCEPRNKG